MTRKVEVDTWGSHGVQMEGLLVDLVSVMAHETIWVVGDRLKGHCFLDNVSLEVVALMGAIWVCR